MVYLLLVDGELRQRSVACSRCCEFKYTLTRYRYEKTGCATLSLIFLSLAFWDKDGSAYRYETRDESGSKDSRTKEALKSKITWIGRGLLLHLLWGSG